MKKRIIIISVVFVLLFAINVSANSQSNLEPTEKRTLVQFCEEYFYRAGVAYDNDLMYIQQEIKPISEGKVGGAFDEYLDKDTIKVSTSGGLLEINPDTLEIEELWTTLFHDDSTDEEVAKYFNKCFLAFSALEYDDWADMEFHVDAVANNGEYDNATEAALYTFDDIIANASFDAEVASNYPVMIARENYDYYILFMETKNMDGEPVGVWEFVAQARD